MVAQMRLNRDNLPKLLPLIRVFKRQPCSYRQLITVFCRHTHNPVQAKSKTIDIAAPLLKGIINLFHTLCGGVP